MKRLPFERLCNSHQKRGFCFFFFFFESKKKMKYALASAHENNKKREKRSFFTFIHARACMRVCVPSTELVCCGTIVYKRGYNRVKDSAEASRDGYIKQKKKKRY